MFQLSAVEYGNFERHFASGKCGTQRFGQAFYDYFKLDKMACFDIRALIYLAPTAQEAKALIFSIFELVWEN